ncbi:uncharacterized protein LOC129260072 [Lytechinus pictus]|uniref:uncharacterized protein LOC129260072 n=1 Tax=Lytechinus pictus TaxID=7653 RepID=UPI0030B9CF6F
MRPNGKRGKKRKHAKSNDHKQEDVIVDEELLQDEELQEKVNWMKHTVPTAANKGKIIKFFKDTAAYRQMMLKKRTDMTITDFITTFPRIQEMPELINMDFETEHGHLSDNFILKWESFYRDRIIKLGLSGYPAVKESIQKFEEGDNRDLCGLTALLLMLHKPLTKTKNPTSSSRASSLEHFIQYRPIGTDVQAAAAGKSAEFRQPYILALGHRRKPLRSFLIADKVVIEAGQNVVEATDRLFKSHVFGVHFAQVIQHF